MKKMPLALINSDKWIWNTIMLHIFKETILFDRENLFT